MVMNEKSLRCFGTGNNFTIIFCFSLFVKSHYAWTQATALWKCNFFLIKRLITQTADLTFNMSNIFGGVPPHQKKTTGLKRWLSLVFKRTWCYSRGHKIYSLSLCYHFMYVMYRHMCREHSYS